MSSKRIILFEGKVGKSPTILKKSNVVLVYNTAFWAPTQIDLNPDDE